jgi:hypothetical protein
MLHPKRLISRVRTSRFSAAYPKVAIDVAEKSPVKKKMEDQESGKYEAGIVVQG